MDNPNGENIESQSYENNKEMNTQREEEKINEELNQKSESIEDNSNNDIENIDEEEKNNEEEQEILRKKKEQEEIEKRKAERKAQLENYEKNYNNLIEKIKNQWEIDKENYLQFYDTQISNLIMAIVNIPCILLNKDVITLAFKFLCKFYSFLKDNFNQIPIKIMRQVCYFNNFNMFLKNPKNIKINNQIDPDNYNLIGDKF